MTKSVSGAKPGDCWRSLARSTALNRTNGWRSGLQILTNGPTEAINGVIETTRRIARGFRNFANYRLRCLLAAGGHRPYRIKQTNHA